MADEHLIRLTELTIRLSDGHKAEVLHELLTLFGDDELAIETIAGWAKDADLLFELNHALLNKMADPGPDLPPDLRD